MRRQPTPELVEACGGEPGDLCRWVFDRTGSDLAAQTADLLAGAPLHIVVILLLVVAATVAARRAIPRVVERAMRERERFETEVSERFGPADEADEGLRRERNRQRAGTLGAVLTSLAVIVVWVVAGLLLLGEVGLEIGPLLAGAGVAGVAIGFGAQSLVRDLLAGTFILLEDQYGVGDVVDVGEANGVVERVGFRVTRLRDVDGVVWFVPNGEIKRVGNMSQLWSRAVIDVDVSYHSDIARAKEVLAEVARTLWQEGDDRFRILDEPEVWGVERFGADGITLRLVVRTVPNQQWTTARELRERIKGAFDERGIEIPFPQRTVWLRSGDGEDDTPPPPGPP